MLVTSVLTEFSKLLTVSRFVLIFTTSVLTEFSKLLTPSRFVLIVVTSVLNISNKLLIDKTAPLFGIEVNKEASPANCP